MHLDTVSMACPSTTVSEGGCGLPPKINRHFCSLVGVWEQVGVLAPQDEVIKDRVMLILILLHEAVLGCIISRFNSMSVLIRTGTGVNVQ